jgi:arylsulfatase A-like enzyme
MVRPHRGVRTERYKLIHYFLPPQEFELYDLEEDPGELHNLYGDPRYAKLAADLRKRIDELRKETGDQYEYQMPNAFEYEKQKL